MNGVDAIEFAVLVMIDYNVLVWVLAGQLCYQGLRKCRLCSVLLGNQLANIYELLNALFDKSGDGNNH
jgi:hypothetical protein